MGGTLSNAVESVYVKRHVNKKMVVASGEMQGWRQNMEDQCTVCLELGDEHPGLSFFAVFDGHAGGLVSEYMAEHLHAMVRAMPDPTDGAALTAVIAQCDADICALPDLRENGSTCICVVAKETAEGKYELTVANVGDSRCLHISGRTGAMMYLSMDHKPSLPAETARIQAAGGTVQMDRVNGQLAMSRAMGDYIYKNKASLPVDQQEVVAIADIKTTTAEAGDLILVCCDGIVEQLTNEQVTTIINERVHAQLESTHPSHDATQDGMKRDLDLAAVVRELFAKSLTAGSKDNMTAMLVNLTSSGGDGDAAVAEDAAVAARAATQMYAGAYHPFKGDSAFVKAYLDDAALRGFSQDEIEALATEAEKTMAPEKLQAPPAAGGDGIGSHNQAMALLQAIMSGQGGGSAMHDMMGGGMPGMPGGGM